MLDKLLTQALGGLLGGGQSAQASNPLLQILGSLLSNSGQGGGGLMDLVQQFQRAGMGSQMQSWVSTGQNMPISVDQLIQVFGQGRMQQMAQQAGMDTQDFGGQMADMLPQMIDRLTPEGQIPSGGFDDALQSLSRLMPR